MTQAATQGQHSAQRGYFDRTYAGYKGYRLENWRRAYIQRIFPELGLVPGPSAARKRFLDVGIGGSGYTVIEAARLGARAAGVDLSPVGVASAGRMAAQALPPAALKRCDFRVCAAEELPFSAASFDAVSSIAVLEHVVDDRGAMAEIARVLKPGGRAYVAVPHSYAKTPLLLGLLNRVNDRVVGHLRHYSARDLADAFGACGLKVEKTLYHAHSVKLAQFVLEKFLPGMRREESRLWWSLERRDMDAWRDEHASMISVVLSKPARRRRG